jgi:hypothetical protein
MTLAPSPKTVEQLLQEQNELLKRTKFWLQIIAALLGMIAFWILMITIFLPPRLDELIDYVRH